MTTTYFLNCMMGNVFGVKTDPSLPTEYYIGLSATAPSADGSGVTEPVGGNYARVKLTSMGEPVDGEITNAALIEFPESTEDWGTMTHYVLFDAASDGNLLMAKQLMKARVVQAENQVCFKPSALKFTLTSEM